MSRKFFLCLTCLAGLFVNSARADEWDFVVAPYGLLPNISGNASLGRINDQDVDLNAGDVLDSLDLGAMLQVEARHESGYGILLNYAFMNLGKSVTGPLGFTNANADIFQGILEGFATRRFAHKGGTFDVYAGARWWDINLDVEATTPIGSRDFSRDEHWVDPVIGLRWMPTIAEQWRLLLQGDVGGFDISSHFTWCAQAGVLWDVSESVSVTLLYKALGVDYETGTKHTSSYFEYDTITQGPLFGVVLRL